jgi:DNA invertase Pin-like site-specific DNA recombinase
MIDPYMRPMRMAISYVRWSSPEQRFGDSKRRQVQRTEEFCKENNLVLDRRLVDSASAYSGKHRRKDSPLSRFLEDLKAGKVPKGAVLIIESLDRLSRQAIPKALELFLGIIRSGVDIVTLIDTQWYSQESIGEVQNLLVSIIAMWRAWEDSRHKGERVGHAWESKREEALQSNAPMTSICPGWLKLSADGKRYEPIKERIKKVKLIFWLTVRGWGKQRIAKLFNRHNVTTWGLGKKAAKGWHHSYIDKILHNRSVLGEFLPHTTKADKIDNRHSTTIRRAVGAVLTNYFPRVISDAIFQKVQLRRTGPRGPIGRKIANLFQRLLKDGEYPQYTMCYKDHGDRWTYVQSDLRRVNPSEPIFSWPYQRLEELVLNYLVKLDWSGLTVEKNAEVRKLSDDLAVAEGTLQDLDKQVRRLVQLAKAAGGIKEAAQELEAIEKRRAELRGKVLSVRSEIAAKKGFSVEEGAGLVKQLAADHAKLESRLRLRNELRRYVQRVELFRTVPASLIKGLKLPSLKPGVRLEELLHSRCVRLLFSNGAERWIVDHGEKPGYGLRFDGAILPPLSTRSSTGILLVGECWKTSGPVSRCAATRSKWRNGKRNRMPGLLHRSPLNQKRNASSGGRNSIMDQAKTDRPIELALRVPLACGLGRSGTAGSSSPKRLNGSQSQRAHPRPATDGSRSRVMISL